MECNSHVGLVKKKIHLLQDTSDASFVKHEREGTFVLKVVFNSLNFNTENVLYTLQKLSDGYVCVYDCNLVFLQGSSNKLKYLKYFPSFRPWFWHLKTELHIFSTMCYHTGSLNTQICVHIANVFASVKFFAQSSKYYNTSM